MDCVPTYFYYQIFISFLRWQYYLTAFMIDSSNSCIHFRTFPFLHNSLEKQLCIDSFSFFSLFKKVLSLWIFSEDVLTDELWFQHCFPDWLSSGVSFSLWTCLLKLVLWSSWTAFNSQYCKPNASSVLFLLFLKIFLEVWRIPSPLLALEEKCHINPWECRFLFLLF